MSKYDFALSLANKKLPKEYNILSEYFSKHKRPLYSIMDTLKFEKKRSNYLL